MAKMDFSKIKLIFLDVDGVIARNYMTPTTKEMLEALSELAKKYHVSLCTGRSVKSSDQIITGAGLCDYYHVLETGSKVSAPGGKYEYEHSLSIVEINNLIEVTKSLDCFYGVCVNGNWIDDVRDVKGDVITILSINTLTKKQTEDVLKVIEPISQNFHISTLVSSFDPNGAHIHITNKNVSKGEGVKYVKKILNVKTEEVLGVGDSIGDIPMLKECGIKVAMGNADDEVKSQVDIVIGDFEDDGLIEFIHENLL
ncbi:MAG TPA: HAD family hydrolase [Candidatus Woesebacteria bacterium]|nr:HAD family hydrolase [Candidatus Woesebacteria bacterium]